MYYVLISDYIAFSSTDYEKAHQYYQNTIKINKQNEWTRTVELVSVFKSFKLERSEVYKSAEKVYLTP